MLDLPGLHLGTTQFEAVSRMILKVKKEKIYAYPWSDLEEDLDDKALTILPVIGYGSLVNPESAAQTFHDQSTKSRRPSIAFGARRLFNYEMPANIDRYLPPKYPRARAALNVRFTGNIGDVVNGIVLNISRDEIHSMRERELGYDLIPVACLEWNELDKPPYLAYILRCPDEFRGGKRRTNENIEPHHQYYRLCRKGASAFGRDFLKLWLATTYLADGVTPVSKWEVTEFQDLD